MANAGGLFIVLVVGLIGLLLSLGTIAAAVYALVAKNARWGLGFGIAAIVGTLGAMVLSLPFWIAVVRGSGSHGEPIKYPRDWPIAAPVVLESLALLGAVAGTARQGIRLRHL